MALLLSYGSASVHERGFPHCGSPFHVVRTSKKQPRIKQDLLSPTSSWRANWRFLVASFPLRAAPTGRLFVQPQKDENGTGLAQLISKPLVHKKQGPFSKLGLPLLTTTWGNTLGTCEVLHGCHSQNPRTGRVDGFPTTSDFRPLERARGMARGKNM